MDNDYQKRLVTLENIHQVEASMFDQLVAVAQLGKGMQILDAGSAYGAVTQAILQSPVAADLTLHLLELSATQLDRARENLAGLLSPAQQASTRFFNESILAPSMDSDSYDRILAKLLWHEIPQAQQPALARVLHRLLTPEGKLVLWQITLDEEIGDFYRAIIREKDRLAGYDNMAAQRHFPNETELMIQLATAGFRAVALQDTLPYYFDSLTRLHSDFRGDVQKQAAWHRYIRQAAQALPEAVRIRLGYRDTGERLEMHFSWGLYVAQK